jgi:catechol 2,3-dioxygenase-like lactoylglutathione lyase family enzyme
VPSAVDLAPGRRGSWDGPRLGTVITAVHTLIYTDDEDATRAFFRDVLALPYVDARDGWLIFKSGPSEVGVHPTSSGDTGSSEPRHEITLMCDDVEKTMAELAANGAEFTRDVRDDGWGLTTSLKVPGAGEMMLYQPRHPSAYGL